MSTENPSPQSWRILNRDGTFNVNKKRDSTHWRDLYHSLLSTSWPIFLSLIAIVYVGLNLIFALLYFIGGPSSLEGADQTSALNFFIDCYFFSVQTLATIGYGKMTPHGLWSNCMVSAEALLGLVGFALITGLFFSRFSRPTAKVLFSNVAIIGPRHGHNTFFFRVANARLNQIAEANVKVTLVRNEITAEGEEIRNLHDLKLVRDRTPFFTLSWTINHIIDEKSPLFGCDKNTLIKTETEIIVSLTGIDETLADTVRARFSYTNDDLIWNKRFVDMIERKDDGNMHIDLKKIHEVQ